MAKEEYRKDCKALQVRTELLEEQMLGSLSIRERVGVFGA